ncbi:unnamed protein product [Gadus morhua 'NCC']
MSPHSVEVPADPVQARGAPALFPVVQMQRQPFDCGPADSSLVGEPKKTGACGERTQRGEEQRRHMEHDARHKNDVTASASAGDEQPLELDDVDSVLQKLSGEPPSEGNMSVANSFGSKKFPQAIIIGVKKGGTRALLEFLRIHPDVRAVGAEPHFFDRFYDKGLEWYR